MRRLRALWARVREGLRLMVGVPDYARYVQHRLRAHPGEPLLSEAEFIAQRQAARYGRSSSRCC